MSTDNLRNNRVDELTTRVLDFHQRRITNAHPSIDDYDYVVRKELKKAVSDNDKVYAAMGGGYGYDKCTFGLGVNSVPLPGTNICPPWIAAYELQPIMCFIAAGSYPTGSAFQARVKKVSTNFFNSDISIPAGGSGVYEKTDFAFGFLTKKDILNCDILSIGSGAPGSNIVIVIKFKIIGV